MALEKLVFLSVTLGPQGVLETTETVERDRRPRRNSVRKDNVVIIDCLVISQVLFGIAFTPFIERVMSMHRTPFCRPLWTVISIT